MDNKYKYLLKNMSIFTISNFSSKLLSFFLVPIYTSILTTSDYGDYDIIMTTMSLAIPVLTLNICDSVVRFSMDRNEDKKNIASLGLKYILVASLIACSLIGLNKLFEITAIFKNFELLVILYFVTNIFSQYFAGFAKGLEKVTDIGIAGVISTFVTLSLNILFLVVLRLGVASFFLANIVAQAVTSIYYIIRLKYFSYVSLSKRDKDLEKRMIAYCVPLIVTSISWIVNDSLDKYVVKILLDSAAVGLLSIAYKIPTILNVVQNIFTQAWQISAVSEKDGTNTNDFYSNTFIYVNFLMSLCCAGLIFLCRPLAYFLYSNDFFEAWRYVPALLISSLLNTASGLLGPILSAKKETKPMATSAILGALTNLVMNILMVHYFGIQGAVVATAVSSFVIYIVRKVYCNDRLNKKVNTVVYLSWLTLICEAWVEVNMQNYLIEILCIALLLLVNREYIKEVLLKIKGLIRR